MTAQTSTRSQPDIGLRRSLERVLAYRNEHVVTKFLERFDVERADAEDIFEQTKKWMWLCARAHDLGLSLLVTQELVVLDEMWHTFILFTRDYEAFCRDHIGRFIHHVPATAADAARRAEALARDPDGVRARDREQLRAEFELIADELGADTLFKWFVDYPRRFDPSFLAAAMKPPARPMLPALVQQLDDIARRYADEPRGHGRADSAISPS